MRGEADRRNRKAKEPSQVGGETQRGRAKDTVKERQSWGGRQGGRRKTVRADFVFKEVQLPGKKPQLMTTKY